MPQRNDTPRHGEAALDLVAKGWAVLPLRGKIPRTVHGVDDATTDPTQVRQWWTRWPTANIGAAVPRCFVVFDVDPRNGGDDAWPQLIAEHGDPGPTLTVWSGRGDGGRHLYFRRPLGELSGARVPLGVDFKIRGYCVIPPSLHPDTGQPYRWEARPPAPLPTAWRVLLRCPPRRPVAVTDPVNDDGRGLVDFVARQQLGNINNALYWAARRAAETGVLDRIADALIAAAVTAGETERRAAATVRSAGRKVSA